MCGVSGGQGKRYAVKEKERARDVDEREKMEGDRRSLKWRGGRAEK